MPTFKAVIAMEYHVLIGFSSGSSKPVQGDGMAMTSLDLEWGYHSIPGSCIKFGILFRRKRRVAVGEEPTASSLGRNTCINSLFHSLKYLE